MGRVDIDRQTGYISRLDYTPPMRLTVAIGRPKLPKEVKVTI